MLRPLVWWFWIWCYRCIWAYRNFFRAIGCTAIILFEKMYYFQYIRPPVRGKLKRPLPPDMVFGRQQDQMLMKCSIVMFARSFVQSVVMSCSNDTGCLSPNTWSLLHSRLFVRHECEVLQVPWAVTECVDLRFVSEWCWRQFSKTLRRLASTSKVRITLQLVCVTLFELGLDAIYNRRARLSKT